jgi:tRNA(Ile)-lysidine synthase
VRIRRRLAEAPWLDVPALARSAAALSEADEALEAMASRLLGERVSGEEVLTLDPAGLPAELLRRLVTRCLKAIAPGAAPRGDQVGALLASLAAGDVATLAGVKCSGGPLWRFEAAPERRTG